MKKSRNQIRVHRKRRIRAKISGTATRPRLCVFRSLIMLSAQIIDDETGKTLVAADSRELKKKKFDAETATELGGLVANKAKKAKIESVVFDRSGYLYHGKIKAFAEGAREGGLKF
ncbi:50S ribosomal protein L18 [bacterium]|jgi:large subunit ribosomal protein L18|nr:50S ribosomal protein L18 [bacterium]MBT4251552.1 50S ribosomal protein L18 [bacterium]MBT4597814.1 50S ribosomal protein L18 [bacterium]MBT6753538.1 50S ribosomal protein L18 [bacterium]MBT7037734.1 50S ribosomal protein L18 [bacterium]